LQIDRNPRAAAVVAAGANGAAAGGASVDVAAAIDEVRSQTDRDAASNNVGWQDINPPAVVKITYDLVIKLHAVQPTR